MKRHSVRSMTGFGRAEGMIKGRKVTVELRSLNSKQLDLLIKLPGACKEREQDLRQFLSDRIIRGKAEMFIISEATQASKRTSFDPVMVKAYFEEISGIKAEVAPGSSMDVLSMVLRLPDVASTSLERVDDAEWEEIMSLVLAAVESFDRFRKDEGARLGLELAQRVESIMRLLDEVELMDGSRASRARERLAVKLSELKLEVDQSRFEQELVYHLDKLDITEEKVRLRTHCTYFTETLTADEPQGRKLGFIAQEMGREINTIGSKSNDAGMQKVVVGMKDELEKVKEQVLNVL